VRADPVEADDLGADQGDVQVIEYGRRRAEVNTRIAHAARIFIAAVVILAAAEGVRGQALTVLPLRHGEIAFAMRATKVNDFVGHASVSRAEFQGTDLTNVHGVLELRVADMQTGIGLRDTHMRHAMREDSFPTIRFELQGVDPGTPHGDTIQVVFLGRLTIHGVTRTVRVPGSVVLRPGAIDVTASTPIDMREYGIGPPKRFFGAIRVDPVTTVTATLGFGKQ
jgi:polyisoprenoid-binding protein YceI